MNSKGRSNNSICEKSMKMVTNIVKLSSFSIAQITLGPSPSTKNLSPSLSGSAKVANGGPPPPLPQFPGSQRAQWPKSGSKPVSYLIELTEGNESTYAIREETSVDGKASDYIRKVHERIRNDSGEASALSPYILPPPPHMY